MTERKLFLPTSRYYAIFNSSLPQQRQITYYPLGATCYILGNLLCHLNFSEVNKLIPSNFFFFFFASLIPIDILYTSR